MRLLNQCNLSASGDWQLEASLYGPLNALLNEFFPVENNFMIKPQGVFRKPMDESTGEAESRKKKSDGIDKEKAKKTKEEVDKEPGLQKTKDELDKGKGKQTSKGRSSYGGQGGRIQYIPDFMIVKATKDTDKDKVVGIVEVKRHGGRGGPDQLEGYLVSALKQSSHENLEGVDEIVGMIIVGQYTKIMKISTEKKTNLSLGDEVTDDDKRLVENVTFGSEKWIKTGGPEFLSKLHELANKFRYMNMSTSEKATSGRAGSPSRASTPSSSTTSTQVAPQKRSTSPGRARAPSSQASGAKGQQVTDTGSTTRLSARQVDQKKK